MDNCLQSTGRLWTVNDGIMSNFLVTKTSGFDKFWKKIKKNEPYRFEFSDQKSDGFCIPNQSRTAWFFMSVQIANGDILGIYAHCK